jgi:hypothetical protein
MIPAPASADMIFPTPTIRLWLWAIFEASDPASLLVLDGA